MDSLAAPSVKTALDIDWDDPVAKAAALARLPADVDPLERWVTSQTAYDQLTPALHTSLTALRDVLEQDIDPDPVTGQRRVRVGVAVDRMPSLRSPEMRHGRKGRSR